MNQRSINLSPWKEISISTEIQHHTLIDIATIIIGDDEDYYIIEDDIEKVMDVSSMPHYIKEDWINLDRIKQYGGICNISYQPKNDL